MTEREKLWKLQEGWKPPPELERGRPRPARYTGAGYAVWVLAVLLLAGGLALGVGISVKADRDQQKNRTLAAATGRAEARITRLWRRGSGGDRKYFADYQFSAGAQVHSRTARLSRRTWSGLREGNSLDVRYVESDPALSRLEGLERSPGTPLWLAPVVAAALALLTVLIARDQTRKRRLVEDGRPAAGMVTKLGRKTDKGRMVYYSFLTLSGSQAQGKYGPVHGKSVPEVGTRLTVIYDPDNPAFNRRYPLSVVTAKQ